MPNVQELAAPVKLLLMDVDGVLTDGRLYNIPDAAGNMVETKAFDSQDGIALQWLGWKGIKTGLISGRKAFQKPMKEGVALLNAIQDVYACKDVTVA